MVHDEQDPAERDHALKTKITQLREHTPGFGSGLLSGVFGAAAGVAGGIGAVIGAMSSFVYEKTGQGLHAFASRPGANVAETEAILNRLGSEMRHEMEHSPSLRASVIRNSGPVVLGAAAAGAVGGYLLHRSNRNAMEHTIDDIERISAHRPPCAPVKEKDGLLETLLPEKAPLAPPAGSRFDPNRPKETEAEPTPRERNHDRRSAGREEAPPETDEAPHPRKKEWAKDNRRHGKHSRPHRDDDLAADSPASGAWRG